MSPSGWPQWGPFCFLLGISLALTAAGCSKVPRYYILKAERGATLSDLMADPGRFHGKVVLLGGAIIEEEANEEFLWLRVKNRPLDQDYVPQLPANQSGLEAGYYWVIVEKNQLPPTYRNWARMTVAGRVTETTRGQAEPVLALLYVRGWGISGKQGGVWEHINPNYVPGPPGGSRYPNMPRRPGQY
ncbi:MAG TPA: Slp family lipoprotein [Nitrospira sp.]|nr:Slp family lipoprotein [Nitrospira sp.]